MKKMSYINCAIVGVGNCASSLVQGIAHYAKNNVEKPPGVMFDDIGGYTLKDIRFTAAFDVDERKIGQLLSKAIYTKPNCTYEIMADEDLNQYCARNYSPKYRPVVERAPILDGVAEHMATNDRNDGEKFMVGERYPDTYDSDLIDLYANKLIKKEVQVLLNYLPVGSQMATEFWAEVCCKANISMVNCIPTFIASDPIWASKFIDSRTTIIGDDMRSQFGASIVSAVLQDLLHSRGLDVTLHYQDNVGGNTDFHNMVDKGRLSSKKISKENVIRRQTELAGKETPENSVHAGPACYFPDLKDNKRAHWLIRAEGFGGAPVEFTADLSVQDSPNSAGVVVDAIRLVTVANEMGIVGPVIGPSAWTQKTPPVELRPHDAYEECKKLANRIKDDSYYYLEADSYGSEYYVHKSYLNPQSHLGGDHQ